MSNTKLLGLLVALEAKSANEVRIYSYLKTMISNMKRDELRSFLRYVTGSCVCTSHVINIDFNVLAGLAMRPIAHT